MWNDRVAGVAGGVGAVTSRAEDRMKAAGVTWGDAGWNYAPYGVALEELERAGGGQMQTPHFRRVAA